MLTLTWKRSLKRAAPPSSITSPCLSLKAKVIEALISGFMLKSNLLPLTPPDLIHPSPSHPSPPPWSATSIQVQHMIGNKNLTHFLFWNGLQDGLDVNFSQCLCHIPMCQSYLSSSTEHFLGPQPLAGTWVAQLRPRVYRLYSLAHVLHSRSGRDLGQLQGRDTACFFTHMDLMVVID